MSPANHIWQTASLTWISLACQGSYSRFRHSDQGTVWTSPLGLCHDCLLWSWKKLLRRKTMGVRANACHSLRGSYPLPVSHTCTEYTQHCILDMLPFRHNKRGVLARNWKLCTLLIQTEVEVAAKARKVPSYNITAILVPTVAISKHLQVYIRNHSRTSWQKTIADQTSTWGEWDVMKDGAQQTGWMHSTTLVFMDNLQ